MNAVLWRAMCRRAGRLLMPVALGLCESGGRAPARVGQLGKRFIQPPLQGRDTLAGGRDALFDAGLAPRRWLVLDIGHGFSFKRW
jgi:hypothetical protein